MRDVQKHKNHVLLKGAIVVREVTSPRAMYAAYDTAEKLVHLADKAKPKNFCDGNLRVALTGTTTVVRLVSGGSAIIITNNPKHTDVLASDDLVDETEVVQLIDELTGQALAEVSAIDQLTA